MLLSYTAWDLQEENGAMDIDRLEELKQKLAHESDLSKIWLFYMDHFADHQEFTDLGEPARSNYLSTVILKNCQHMFGKSTKVTDFFLISIAKYKFFHGPLNVEGRIGGMIYFKDIKTGLIAVSSGFPATDEVKYARFSEAFRLSDPRGFDRN
jgi:hypothetical protein